LAAAASAAACNLSVQAAARIRRRRILAGWLQREAQRDAEVALVVMVMMLMMMEMEVLMVMLIPQYVHDFSACKIAIIRHSSHFRRKVRVLPRLRCHHDVAEALGECRSGENLYASGETL
jgi:hypothetical protein